ncbi:hypothetical protein F4806DRAFT_495949 [Annulohypoxylon nitens]|nr:hypothetical protein F4806DRAFT_495949 [Annulohypoxylon nitens]
MSIRISLDAPPEFYTNLDFISGRVILVLHRAENIGNVIVKLEGESRTALTVPSNDRDDYYRARPPGGALGGDVITENHKILYRVFQVYPDDGASIPFQPGMHEFKFNFKMPLNNICHDEKAMSTLLGLGGIGGSSGFRTMDGTKQLMLQHVKSTLPPSLTGFPQEAEIRYYLKVTIQRPGFFKENWRYQMGFKFLPIEPPRPAKTSQEAFARRPFTFRPRAPQHHRKSIFGNKSPTPGAENEPNQMPPNIEMSARLPFPSIVTCNDPLPLRIIARKLASTTTRDQTVYLTALEIALIGYTQVRVQNLENTEVTKFLVFSAPRLSPPLALFDSPSDPVDTEFEIPRSLWAEKRLPNTVAPSFRTCNLSRRYEIQMMITLSWGTPTSGSSISLAPGKQPLAQAITLPLKLSNVEVFSGIAPPQELLNSINHTPSNNIVNAAFGIGGPHIRPPHLPQRPSGHGPPNQQNGPQQQQRPPQDPLYPPQLGTPANAMFDDAPPSYDEAMADRLAGPAARPAYSGVTAENAPSTMPAQKA